MTRKPDPRPLPPRDKDDPRHAPESSDKPDAAKPAMPPERARRPADHTSEATPPQDQDPMGPDAGDKLEGGPMGRGTSA